jgi:hypothetical protein
VDAPEAVNKVEPPGQIVEDGFAETFIVGKGFTTKVTVLVEALQGELVTVQTKT